jgi:hypothetical protein
MILQYTYTNVTFKDLKKIVSLEAATPQQSRLSEILKDKPFWIWNIEVHKHEDIKTNGDCCFNHIIALPQKDSVDKQPMIVGYTNARTICIRMYL